MIVRKPYAFLIKNFKKIHIVLLLFSVFVAYKLFDVNSYVSRFVRRGTYDMFNDPISKHITFWLMFAIFLLILGSVALLALLLYKKKPWKVYLIPVIEYTALLIVLSTIKNYFEVNKYASSFDMADIRLTQDLLFISILVQFAAIGIYIMRIFGLDMKKFQFNIDKEFLELSEADREEVEIGFNIDKHSFIRGYKRLFRNCKYFYLEHKGICIGLAVFIVLMSVFQIWKFFFVIHKVYTVGEYYSVDGYTFQIHNAYFTDKDLNGNVIEQNSNFIILDLTVTNHEKSRTLNLETFHIHNGSYDFTTTKRIYAHEFQDFGTAYESTRKIKKDETQDLIIVFRVDKKIEKKTLNPKRYVLYYQEKSGQLRKIKLTLSDVSEIEPLEIIKLGDSIELNLKNHEDTIRFDYSSVVDMITYTAQKCVSINCSFKKKKLEFHDSTRVLKIDFASDSYEAKDMKEFLKNYGTLYYTDDAGEDHMLEYIDPISEAYYGKSIFIQVPQEVMKAKNIYYDLIVRNHHYHCDLMNQDLES